MTEQQLDMMAEKFHNASVSLDDEDGVRVVAEMAYSIVPQLELALREAWTEIERLRTRLEARDE